MHEPSAGLKSLEFLPSAPLGTGGTGQREVPRLHPNPFAEGELQSQTEACVEDA